MAVHVACDAICRLSQRLFSLSTLVTHMAMCLLTRCTLFTESQFPFESASGGDMAGRRQTESAGGGGGGGSWGPGDGIYAYGDGGFAFEGNGKGAGAGRGATGVQETDMHAGGRRSEGGGMRDARRVPLGGPERDMYGQTSLERLEEENSSLRAITKYLIHERKELRKKADMASKRNQNLNNLLQVMKWSLQQGGSGGVSGACGASSFRAMPGLSAANATPHGSLAHSIGVVPEGDWVRCPPPSPPPPPNTHPTPGFRV